MMKLATCIEDLRQMHRRRVPRMFYDYVDSGSWSEATYHANEDDFARLKFRQKVAVDVSGRSTKMPMLEQMLPMPVALAPTGFAGMQYADGEILAAKAAADFGVPFTLSTLAICSIEDVAEATDTPFWFQLYVMRDRDFVRRLIARAKSAKCSALMLTLDLQLMGQRHKDIKNGLSAPPRLTIGNIINMMTKPSWCMNMLTTKRREFRNIVGHVEGVDDMRSLASWTADQFDTTLNWDDVAAIRKTWDGAFIIKGILDVEDAKAAANIGVDAVVVSNHGGRQLDGTCSTIAMLPQIVDAIGKTTDVWLDSGIRSGQDVLRAVALGAKGTLIGRAYLYGLGAGGGAGVTKALELIHKELDTTLGLCGEKDLAKVGADILLS